MAYVVEDTLFSILLFFGISGHHAMLQQIDVGNRKWSCQSLVLDEEDSVTLPDTDSISSIII